MIFYNLWKNAYISSPIFYINVIVILSKGQGKSTEYVYILSIYMWHVVSAKYHNYIMPDRTFVLQIKHWIPAAPLVTLRSDPRTWSQQGAEWSP